MTITAKELDQLMENAQERAENWDGEGEEPNGAFVDYGSAWSALKYEDYFPVQLSDEVFITARVADFGGMEQGTEYWLVIAVTTPSGTQLFRKDGYYQSYDGGYLDGNTYEVEPVERIVTFYERKK